MGDWILMEQFQLYTYLKEIDDIWKFSLESLEDRIKLQKLVYLMQAVGLRLKYNYNLYLHGPYSPELTRDAFELNSFPAEVKEYILKNNELDTDDYQKLSKVKGLIRDLDETRDFEVLATLVFLKRETYIPEKSEDKIRQALLRHKPYAEDNYDRCWQRLKDFDMV